KPTDTKQLYISALETYMERLDTYKIVFTKEDLSNFVKMLPEESLDSEAEVNIIYDAYNRYISTLRSIRAELSSMQPQKPFAKSLPDSLALNSDELAQHRNDFVYERYLRAELMSTPKSSLPKLIDTLIGLEISKNESATRSKPLTVYFNSLGKTLDPHTYYESNDSSNVESGLMGFIYVEEQGVLNIERVIAGSSAEEAGIKPGDKIVGYEHTANEGYIYTSTFSGTEFGVFATAEPGHVSNLIIDRHRKRILVSLKRKSNDSLMEFASLATENAETIPQNNSVKLYFIVDNDKGEVVPVIQVKSFEYEMGVEPSITKQFVATFNALQAIFKVNPNMAKRLVLDLRDNPGGYVDEAVNLAQIFSKEPIAILNKHTNGEDDYFKADTELADTANGIPLVLWINERCASACEMFSSIIQDTGRGLLIGAPRTYGKGVGQTVTTTYAMPDMGFSSPFLNNVFGIEDEDEDSELGDTLPTIAGQLAITTFTYYRLNGDTVQLTGLRPDIILPSGHEFSKIGMDQHANAIPKSRGAPTTQITLKHLDARQVSQMQNTSVRRWLSDPYFTFTKANQQIEDRLASRQERSLDIDSRREFNRSIKKLESQMDRIKEQLKQKEYTYDITTADNKSILDKVDQASIQEFAHVTADYFQSLQ
ncbi:MAG: hypothetical protein KDD37_09840, partial [Bdellovibrionales bacterium]|nr:hypothetical protein [Bdellovibrionales bacterium]